MVNVGQIIKNIIPNTYYISDCTYVQKYYGIKIHPVYEYNYSIGTQSKFERFEKKIKYINLFYVKCFMC